MDIGCESLRPQSCRRVAVFLRVNQASTDTWSLAGGANLVLAAGGASGVAATLGRAATTFLTRRGAGPIGHFIPGRRKDLVRLLRQKVLWPRAAEKTVHGGEPVRQAPGILFVAKHVEYLRQRLEPAV